VTHCPQPHFIGQYHNIVTLYRCSTFYQYFSCTF